MTFEYVEKKKKFYSAHSFPSSTSQVVHYFYERY